MKKHELVLSQHKFVLRAHTSNSIYRTCDVHILYSKYTHEILHLMQKNHQGFKTFFKAVFQHSCYTKEEGLGDSFNANDSQNVTDMIVESENLQILIF